MNALASLNDIRHRDLVAQRDAVMARRPPSPPPAAGAYPLAALRVRIVGALRERFGTEPACELTIIDRARFGADVALRLPGLLRECGAQGYIVEHVPAIVDALRAPALDDVVAQVDHTGIHVNIRLAPSWFLAAVAGIVELGDRFGHTDTRAGRTDVLDYSSPNVAKVLHAGHLRSTIIGDVLGNLYEACGALVYRVNHINDFGGFGFMLEGHRRFAGLFPPGLGDNERSLEVYAIRRAMERVVASGDDLDAVPEADRELVARYFPGVTAADELRASYAGFVAASDERFHLLEDGDPTEVALWRQVVDASLSEFRTFYAALDIDIEFTIGESFYLQAGDRVLEEAVANGRAFELTAPMVEEQTARLDASVAAGELTTEARDRAVAFLAKDLGALVVPLPDGERLVARRSDGRSIYATRDLGAIAVRRELFAPTDVTYVVGQEQQVHFARLFEAAGVLGLVGPGEVRMTHTHFGFYVDAASGRKLSSRDSVAGVNELLAASVDHYRTMTAASGGLSAAEIESAAHQLAVGSVVFNDLKSDMKGTVSIATGDVGPVIAAFEKSGGPYVVYAACRARAILRRYGRPLPRAVDIGAFDVDNREALLILRLLELPEKVARAAAEDNPAILVRYLLDLAALYNSYYASAPVLQGDRADEFRLLITRSVQLVLVNGLRLCHVECPPQI